MKRIAIIPARGGSKRIPRKNVKDFLGMPIIAYSIRAALESGVFDEVMVSTDDEEIASVATFYGANVPFLRSAETSSDFATISDVIKEVLFNYKTLGVNFDYMCCILPTSPMLKSSDILKGFDKLTQSNFSTVIPVVKFSYPIQRAFQMDSDGGIDYKWPEYAKSRSQDLLPTYHDSGTFYWNKVNRWLRGDISRGGIVVSEETVQDIDTEEDWKIAELKYKILHNLI